MIAPLHATLACCGARATPSNLIGHKCKGRGGDDAKARAAPDNDRLRPAQGGAHPAPLRPGRAAEDLLAAALVDAHHDVITYDLWLWRALRGDCAPVFVREFPVGLLIEPVRRFRADLFHTTARLCVEIEGGAHGIQRQRRGDILREQLLTSAGLRVVRVLPEQVRDGSAVELVKRAVAGRA